LPPWRPVSLKNSSNSMIDPNVFFAMPAQELNAFGVSRLLRYAYGLSILYFVSALRQEKKPAPGGNRAERGPRWRTKVPTSQSH
jgi:hypothetical protein